MTTLIIAEHDNQQLRSATRSAVTAGIVFGQPIDVLVVGHHVNSVAKDTANITGIARVLQLDAAHYENPLAEDLAPRITALITEKNYTRVVIAATSFGKNLLPRIAGLLDVDMVSEVTGILNENTYTRPLYAGNLNAVVQNSAEIQLISIRPTAFTAAINSTSSVSIEILTPNEPTSLTQWVATHIQPNDRPDLSTARVVVSGGRSLKSADDFAALIYPLANTLNAAVGATRAAVDAGIAPNELQVGQTGTVVAPELYLAIGVSGAPQHIAGMKDSRIVVAINQDPDAPIFKYADYGLVADLFTSLPELEKALAS